jgi:hypothetical protein
LKGRVWDWHKKGLIVWIYCVLLINALNYFVFYIIEIVFLVSDNQQNYDRIHSFTLSIAMFWLDTLNLTNGLCFLKLFESMARSSLKHRNIVPVKEANGYSSSNNNKRLLNEDSSDNKREMQSWGTNSVRDLLNQDNRTSINDDFHNEF